MQQPPSRGAGGTGGLHPSSQSSVTSPTPSTSSNPSPSSAVGETASELKADARQLSSKAANRLHSEVDARKGTAVSQARTVSSALERTAGQLEEGAPEWLRSTFRQGAEPIQRFAQSMEQKDSRQLMRDVENFARERPARFLAACTAAGFAAARIFKAGGEQPSSQRSPYSPQASFDEPRFGASDSDQAFTPRSTGELV